MKVHIGENEFVSIRILQELLTADADVAERLEGEEAVQYLRGARCLYNPKRWHGPGGFGVGSRPLKKSIAK